MRPRRRGRRRDGTVPGQAVGVAPRQASSTRMPRFARASLRNIQQATQTPRTASRTSVPRAGSPSRATSAVGTKKHDVWPGQAGLSTLGARHRRHAA